MPRTEAEIKQRYIENAQRSWGIYAAAHQLVIVAAAEYEFTVVDPALDQRFTISRLVLEHIRNPNWVFAEASRRIRPRQVVIGT